MAHRITPPIQRALLNDQPAPLERRQVALIMMLIVFISAAATALLLWSDSPL